jgi:O-acetyl-ADP-ribose deacetylase (regulator of RNase III)
MSNNPENIKIFISYKKRDDNSSIAPPLAEILAEYYDVFIDIERLEVGHNWAEGIYTNIRESDVLIVVIEKGAAESDWVQREVDVARGAHVSILPLRVGDEAETEDVVTKLALFDTQHFIGFDIANDVNIERLCRDIDRLAANTRMEQKKWRAHIAKRRRLKAAPNQDSVYTVERSGVQIHLATGDMTALKVDVMVNSENDHMQMARFFDSAALSAALRLAGAYVTRGRIREDTVQMQIDHQLNTMSDYAGRPIVIGEGVVTYAGHTQSRLVKQGVRYIIHMVTGRMEPFTMGDGKTWIDSDAGIRQAVYNALDFVQEINAKKGRVIDLITPPFDNPAEPVRSLALPVFGTGTGGLAFMGVVEPMVAALYDYDWARSSLENVYLCIYPLAYVDKVEDTMQIYFNG